MKIKTKLSIGFSLLLLLLVGVTSFGYIRLSQMNQSINHFYDYRFEKVKIALAVRGEINATGRIMNDITIGDQDTAEGIDAISAGLTKAGDHFKTLTDLELSPDEQDVMDGVMILAEEYTLSLGKFIDLLKSGKVNEAKKLYTDSLRDEQRQIIDSMDGLVKTQENALVEEMADSRELYDRSVQMVAILTIVGLMLGLAIVMWVFPSITKGLNLLERMADRFGKGRLRGFARFEIKSQDELGQLAQVFKIIALDLQVKNEREAMLSAIQQRQARMNAQIAKVTEFMQEGTNARLVAQSFISEFAPVLGASYGLVYLTDPTNGIDQLELSGSYAILIEGTEEGIVAAPLTIRPGEGLTGQCYRDAQPIVLEGVPEGYVKVGSGLGSTDPKAIAIQPILYENNVIGVIELASITGFNSEQKELLNSLSDKLGTILNNIHSRSRVEELLRESQAMTEELQVQSEELVCQQEELRETNDKLEQQQKDLKKSEQRLQQQQEQLEEANKELTVKKLALEQQIDRVEMQNRQIAEVNSELERQALQLALTSKYKSEFLANMSHELRTPLNSLLILSEFLVENNEKNLTEQQREYMKTIHLSGNDLLKMIDEILDLSKVDAGKMEVHAEWTVLGDLSLFLNDLFTPLASSKMLSLTLDNADDIPGAIWTDGHRLKQILRNLLSNAIKFTDSGSVSFTIRRPNDRELKPDRMEAETRYIALSVTDTGIGIPRDKHELVFEAFRQADGTTSRKYGGTGLGLTISKELAHLLGGWIYMESEPGKGSTFTLVIPEQHSFEDYFDEPHSSELTAATSELIFDAETELRPEDERSGLSEAIQDSFIAEESESPEDNRNRINKLPDRESTFKNKKILLVDDDVRNVFTLSSVLEHRNMRVVTAENGREALNVLERDSDIDLVLMDIMMPVMDGYETMRRIRASEAWNKLPIIALTAKAMKDDRNKCIEAGASDYITKPVNTDQLLSLMRVWLHR
ncbi:response regulator [Cohnella herbarum]|uniref:Circadian input-output histidine kinase CikA n=1 Tax=Cohnella herbarum TaxID=2728023 RepID=A0A7Z2VJX2_9BACL|nr:response regulator [Cohnella herbarum]QJD84361.1 response regulator [Cohnella herbarum]